MLQCTDDLILQSTVEFILKRSSCLNVFVLVFLPLILWMFIVLIKKHINTVLFITSFNCSIKQWNQKLYIYFVGYSLSWLHLCFFSHMVFLYLQMISCQKLKGSFSHFLCLMCSVSLHASTILITLISILYNTVICTIKSDPQSKYNGSLLVPFAVNVSPQSANGC